MNPYAPHPCVILAIDPGTVSGWAVMRDGHVPGMLTGQPPMGTATNGAERAEAIRTAQAFAAFCGLRLVVVAETWPRRMAGGLRVGAFASWPGWREALDEAGVPKRRIVRVQVGRWSAAILGRAALTTEQRRAQSLQRAQQAAAWPMSHDTAAAICIGLWATHAPEVAKALPKARSRQAADKSATSGLLSKEAR